MLKRNVLYLSKWAGFFRVAQNLTRNGLRILCYHGFAIDDEWQWQPKLFIRPETFRRRMQFLEKEHFPVLPLEQALERLSEKSLPDRATVITVDDGFFSTKSLAHPILTEKSFPYTIYIASYYSLKETPIFNLVMQYMFWKTRKDVLDCREIGLPLTETVQLSDSARKAQTLKLIIDYGGGQLTNDERGNLMKRVGACLGVDYSAIERTRLLSLVTASEISELVAAGVDIQLHTHRHRWQSADQSVAVRELADNKAFLEPLAGKPLQHFCYPSGFWSPAHAAYLDAAGIRSATTCEAGLNDSQTPRLRLRRFLDGENLSQIEFEALLCGYIDLLKHPYRSFLQTHQEEMT